MEQSIGENINWNTKFKKIFHYTLIACLILSIIITAMEYTKNLPYVPYSSFGIIFTMLYWFSAIILIDSLLSLVAAIILRILKKIDTRVVFGLFLYIYCQDLLFL
jgi:hypothetical protein